MAKDTKERILQAALEIFARDGYAGTNIKDIADSVGIVKSALYRHFESKEALWDAVFDRIAVYYEERFGSPNRIPGIPQSTEELYTQTMRMIDFTIHDEKIKMTRKLLLTEQFRSERMRDAANDHFLFNLEKMFTEIFAAMMENGTIKKCDPAVLAFSYTTPITSLVHLCDRDPDREQEAKERLQAFVKQFISVYAA